VALTVNMPQLGESVTEGTIARWLKQPGEAVAKYESIAEVASDKVNAEIPAPADGTLGEIIATEGAVVTVGQPICTIEQGAAGGGEGATAAATAQPREPRREAAPPRSVGKAAGQGEEAAQGETEAAQGETETAAEAAAAPAPAPRQAEPAGAPGQPEPRPSAAAATAQPPAQQGGPPEPGEAAGTAGTDGAGVAGGAHHLTPAVRMLVREHEVDLDEIQGTGIGGRITKKDVLEYVQRRDAAARAGGGARPGAAPAEAPAAPRAAGASPAAGAAPGPSPAAPPQAPARPAPGPELGEGDRLVAMTSVRRAIADHMVRSKHTSPHAWLMVEVDMSRVSRVREARRAEFRERYGVSLTYLPFVARAVIEALRRRPTLNAQWSEEGVVLKHDIHLGIAVALEENLVVPVLRHADRLSIAGLAQAMADLGERARANRLKLDEIQGGTFTLNNTGALGAVITQAIINQPQAAICTMDAVVKRPVVIDDMIGVRPMMNLGLSFDHRINDGLQAARFLQDVRGQLEGLDESAALL
jgi:2-oxoisovalerate dehydrogenase E2 component (dihydrolipoyl transacylase)